MNLAHRVHRSRHDRPENESLKCESMHAERDMHAAAALDRLGGLLGVREFPATAAGYAGRIVPSQDVLPYGYM
jgi:hypothetical protein